MYASLGVSREVYEFGQSVLDSLKARFEGIDAVAEYNQAKVIRAMQEHRVDATCFAATTGYGYDDLGRDKLERVYASAFGTEAALVRPQITCGTHALAVALSANLLPGDELLSPNGAPYDTLEEVIGIRESQCSLKEYGVIVPAGRISLPDGTFDFEGIRKAINEKTKLVTIQRSEGLRHAPVVLRCADRRAHRVLQAVQAGRDLHGGQLLRRICRAGRAVERRRGHDRRQPDQKPRRRPGPDRRLYLRHGGHVSSAAPIRLSAPGLGQEVGANLGLLPSHVSGLLPRAERRLRCAQGRDLRGESL